MVLYMFSFRGHWDVTYLRFLHEWQLESVDTTMDLLYSNLLSGVGEDRLWWRLSKNGKFEILSFY